MNAAFLLGSISRQAGGLFTSVRRLAQELHTRERVQTHVLALHDQFTEADLGQWQPLAPEIFARKGPNGFGYAPELRRRLQSLQPDIAHLHGLWMYTSVAGLHWQRGDSRRCVISPRGMLDGWALRNSWWKKRVAGWLFENENLRRAACIHALSESEARAIRAYGLRNPICVIPNGIDLPPQGRVSSVECRVSGSPLPLAPGTSPKVLLYLGRIHPKKGLVNLLKAWKQVSGQCSNWVLAIAGWDQDGHEAELKSLARSEESEMRSAERGTEISPSPRPSPLRKGRGRTVGSASLEGRSSSVAFLGPQFNEAKANCYAQCDAFILPSFSEGLPMAILEAWAHGKPVLMTPHCNLLEGVQAGAALEMEPATESIARALQTLFSMSDSERRTMGERGRSLVAEKFSWPAVASEMKRVYDWLLGGGPKPSSLAPF
jgi:poly(glycerol-phosphate) alpha-glucosyltransferase